MSDEAAEEYDAAAFEALIGKHLLIGLSFYDKDGKLESQVQHDGIIIAASQSTGIVIQRSDGGETFAIPPALDHLTVAEPGVYELRSGRIVSNPDLVTTFNIYPPEDGA